MQTSLAPGAPLPQIPGHLGVLDGLRGAAILLVVWYHLSLVSGYAWPALPAVEMFAHGGFLGVDLFFFVSGFCICYPYARASRDGVARPGLRDFARRRARKILPSYVLAVAVFALVYHARFDGLADELPHVLAHLAFVHVWFPATFGSLSGPLWTLGVEVQFYVLFAFLRPQIVRRPGLVYAVFVATAVGYRALLAHSGLDTDFDWLNQLPAVLDVFGAGMLAAFAFIALRDRPAQVAPRLATLGALGALVAIVGAFIAVEAIGRAAGDDGVHRWLNAWRVSFGPVLVVATLGIALGTPHLRALAGARALAFLSLVSYNAYLWNLEIAVGLHNAGLPPWAVFWVGAGATLLVAVLVTYGFERPILRAGIGATTARLRRALTLAPRPPATRLAG
jgi:peptidoglycan/LPS O-acetylase OafA/YrhL